MLWVCCQCSTAYAVGLAACPHCGSTDYRPDWEDDMPKSTYEGPSYEEGREPPGFTPPPADEPEPEAPPLIPVADQKAAGVPPEAVVTIADQKAGVPPPELPDPPPDSTPPPSSPESSAPADG